MVNTSSPTIAALGNLIVDDIVFADGTTRMAQAGGAVVHFALGAALWGCHVGIVSVVGDDYPVEILEGLEARGINLDGVRRIDGPGMRTWLLHEDDRRQVLHRLSSPSHHSGSPTFGDIPTSWSPSTFHLAPMPLDRQHELLVRLRASTEALLSVDPYALIDEATWDDCMQTFALADILLASDDEILLDPDVDHRDRWLASGIPLVLAKQGERGGTIYNTSYNGADGRAVPSADRWEARADEVIDVTGAGDAFAGGLLAGLADGEHLDGALKKALISAALTLECGDVEAMLAVTESAALERHRQWWG